MTTQDIILAQTTLGKHRDAVAMANSLIEARLCACVQIAGPVTSVYRWQGRVETAEEYVVSGKTTARRWPAVCERIKQLHPYDVPEIIAVPLNAVSEHYAQWLTTQCE